MKTADGFAGIYKRWASVSRSLETEVARIRGIVSQPDEMPLGKEGDPDPRDFADSLRIRPERGVRVGADE